jgi:release factor glutamine methyltransferase
MVTFVDVDQNALECARANAKTNEIEGNFILSDMFEKIEGKFNTIIFNPPYVISEENRHLALDGGKDGRGYIDRFIRSYKDYILDEHVVLLLESSFNKYEKDVKRLNARIVSKEHYFFEDLVVLLF